MSTNDQIQLCDACGLLLKGPVTIDENNHKMCMRCTEEGSNEPVVEVIVYGVTLGYFMGK